jgi:hypothetical protein
MFYPLCANRYEECGGLAQEHDLLKSTRVTFIHFSLCSRSPRAGCRGAQARGSPRSGPPLCRRPAAGPGHSTNHDRGAGAPRTRPHAPPAGTAGPGGGGPRLSRKVTGDGVRSRQNEIDESLSYEDAGADQDGIGYGPGCHPDRPARRRPGARCRRRLPVSDGHWHGYRACDPRAAVSSPSARSTS